MTKHDRIKQNAAALARSACGQLAVLLGVLFLFFGSAIRATRHRSMQEPACAWTIFLVLGAALALTAAAWLALSLRQRTLRPKAWLCWAGPLALLLLVSAALRLPQWGTLPRDDGVQYYTALHAACQEFNYTIENWFVNFRLCGHMSWGLATLAAIPEFLFPHDYNNVWLFQTGVSLVTVGCVYDIFSRALPGRRRAAFFGALMFGCGPMFLGLDTFFQMDFTCACVIFWVIWAAGRGQCLLLLAAALLQFTTKELGIGLLVGFCLAALAYEMAAAPVRGFWRRLGAALCRPYLAVLLGTGFVCGLAGIYYIFLSGQAWSVLTVGGDNPLGYIGLDGSYALFKLLQILTINFTWLVLAAAGAAAFAARRAGVRLSAGVCFPLCAAAGAFAGYYALSALAVTVASPRYSIPMEMLLQFAAALVLAALLPARRGAAACGALAALLGVQAYLTVDPLMKALYPQMQTDTAFSMVRPTTWRWNVEDEYMGSGIIYNYQYTFVDRCLRQIFIAEDYDADTDIITIGQDSWMYIGGKSRYGWEPSQQDFTFSFGPETLFIDTTQIDVEDTGRLAEIRHENGELKSKAIFVWTPRMLASDVSKEERAACIPDYYTNIEAHEVSDGIFGSLTYFTADYIG